MEKPKIYSTGNENVKGESNVAYYIVEKNEKFLDWLRELVVHVLEIKETKSMVKYIKKTIEDEEGHPIDEVLYTKDITKMVDVHEHYQNKGDRVDVFYGNKRVFLALRRSNETRKKFADFVEKTREWIVVEKVPELPFYVGAQIARKS